MSKVLTSEQQVDLRLLIEAVSRENLPLDIKSQLTYWSIELKPKRSRKKETPLTT